MGEKQRHRLHVLFRIEALGGLVLSLLGVLIVLYAVSLWSWPLAVLLFGLFVMVNAYDIEQSGLTHLRRLKKGSRCAKQQEQGGVDSSSPGHPENPRHRPRTIGSSRHYNG